jgi:hypothetical protein
MLNAQSNPGNTLDRPSGRRESIDRMRTPSPVKDEPMPTSTVVTNPLLQTGHLAAYAFAIRADGSKSKSSPKAATRRVLGRSKKYPLESVRIDPEPSLPGSPHSEIKSNM